MNLIESIIEPCALPSIGAPASEFEALLHSGWAHLNRGTGRIVYKHPRCPWVLKDNPCPGCGAPEGSLPFIAAQKPHHCHGANDIEIKEWLARSNVDAGAYLDPVGEIVTWSLCRRYLIMEYLRDLTKSEQPVVICRYTDLKRENFGVDADNRIKLRDYTEVREPLAPSPFI